MITFRSLPILSKQRLSISSALATWFPSVNSFYHVIHTSRFEGMQIKYTSFVPFHVAIASKLTSRGRSRGCMEGNVDKFYMSSMLRVSFLSITNKGITCWANIAISATKNCISVASRIRSYFGTANLITCVRYQGRMGRGLFGHARNQSKGAYG